MVPDDRHLARLGLLEAASAQLALEPPEGGEGGQACGVLPGLDRDQVKERVARSAQNEVAEPLGLPASELGKDRLHERLVGVGMLRAGSVADESMGHGNLLTDPDERAGSKDALFASTRPGASFWGRPASSGHEGCAG